MNLGIFAGGMADGYSKGLEDQRKQQENKRRQDEADRQEADRKLDDEVNQQTADYMRKRLGVIADKPDPVKPVADAVVENPAARGVAGEVPQVAQPSSPIAGGIQAQSEAAPIEAQKPKVRQPDINDMVDVAQHRASLYLQKGNYTKAIDAHKDYMAFAAEKLKSEEGKRAGMARSTVAGIMAGDYSGLGAFYDALPDGNKLQNVTPNKDGTITVEVVGADGKGKPPVTFKNGEHLANAVVSLVDTNAALQYMDRSGRAEIEAKKLKFAQDHDNQTLAETRRHNRASEGIALTKADAEKKPTYKTDTNEVATAFGTPAVDGKGRPITDPMSGRQQVNRNLAEEKKYRAWANQNGITDDNEGLAKYPPLRGESLTGEAAPAPAAVANKNIDWSKY